MANFCKHCGEPLDANSRFCGNCGAIIGTDVPNASAAKSTVMPTHENTEQFQNEKHHITHTDTGSLDVSPSPFGQANNTNEAIDSRVMTETNTPLQSNYEKKKSRKKRNVVIGVIAAALVVIVAAVLVIFVWNPFDPFKSIYGEYSLVRWYSTDNFDEENNVEYMEYSADKQYVLPTKLTVKDKSNIQIINQIGDVYADITIDEFDSTKQSATGIITLRKTGVKHKEVKVSFDENIIIIHDTNDELDYVYNKQPLDRFKKLFNGRSSVSGTLTSLTTYSEDNDRIEDKYTFIEEASNNITINSDGTGVFNWSADVYSLEYSFTFDPDDMTTINCEQKTIISKEEKSYELYGYFSIDADSLKFYCSPARVTFTFKME